MPKRSQTHRNADALHQTGAREHGGTMRESDFDTLERGDTPMSERAHETLRSMQDGISRGYHRAEDAVARNPGSSVLLSLGIGFGLGLVLTTILSRSEESWSEWSSRQARDAMRHARDSTRQAEHFARDLPDTFQHLADSIRHLPEAIARHLPSMGGRHA